MPCNSGCGGGNVIYRVTLANGATKDVRTYAEVTALLRQHGGTYKVVKA